MSTGCSGAFGAGSTIDGKSLYASMCMINSGLVTSVISIFANFWNVVPLLKKISAFSHFFNDLSNGIVPPISSNISIGVHLLSLNFNHVNSYHSGASVSHFAGFKKCSLSG
jgi:hypothetical protein